MFNKYTWVVKVLMQRDDLKPFLKNNDGQTPLQLATAFGFNEIAVSSSPPTPKPCRSLLKARGP